LVEIYGFWGGWDDDFDRVAIVFFTLQKDQWALIACGHSGRHTAFTGVRGNRERTDCGFEFGNTPIFDPHALTTKVEPLPERGQDEAEQEPG